MKKYIYTVFVILLLSNCQTPKKPNKTCCVVDNLIGDQYLDSSYLTSIENIETNKKLEKSTNEMVLIHGGTFEMGADIPEYFKNMPATGLAQPDEFPKHKVTVSDFFMDEHEVTIGEFAEFVKETGYKTVAEQDIDWEELKKQVPAGTPKPNENLLKAGALIFNYIEKNISNDNLGNWWTFTTGVNWKNPNGKNLTLEKIKNWPVTQISWYDALAYAKWCGKRLPTEAEFEYAMRGGKKNKMYPWGNQKLSENLKRGNFLQGDFPYVNTAEDGFEYTAPIKQFPPNSYGLYDISGNVWEWTSDWYSPVYYEELKNSGKVAVNPTGPNKSVEVYNRQAVNKSVKGGSFLCNDSWCSGYRNARRMRLSPDTGMQHLGFRLVRDTKKN
jgi:formylglycine-generating enzyme required for sulfatase activity